MDPGLQPERTALAWSRTAAGLLANALIVLRSGYVGGSHLVVALAMTLVVAAGATYVMGMTRRKRLDPCIAADAEELRRVTLMVVLACICAMMAVAH